MIKSRIVRLVGHVSHMGGRRGVYRVLVGNLHLEDPSADGRIILIWNFKSEKLGYGMDRAGSG